MYTIREYAIRAAHIEQPIGICRSDLQSWPCDTEYMRLENDRVRTANTQLVATLRTVRDEVTRPVGPADTRYRDLLSIVPTIVDVAIKAYEVKTEPEKFDTTLPTAQPIPPEINVALGTVGAGTTEL